MAKVGIVMGSDSDLPVMSKAAEMLEKFGIEYELTVISAHRMPDVFFDYAKTAEEKGFKVIIAGAGGAAHLPGMCAAIFPMPDSLVRARGKLLWYNRRKRPQSACSLPPLSRRGTDTLPSRPPRRRKNEYTPAA